jgi:hypothetical protein
VGEGVSRLFGKLGALNEAHAKQKHELRIFTGDNRENREPMKKFFLSALCGFLVAALIVFIFWCGGYDFVRGATGGFCAFIAIACMLLASVAAYVFQDINERY